MRAPCSDETGVRQQHTDDVAEPPGDHTAVTSPPRGSPPAAPATPEQPPPPAADQEQEQERDRRRAAEIVDLEELNDDDVSVDDRLDVASLGDGSDDEILRATDYAESPFSVAPENPPDDVIEGNPPDDVVDDERRSAGAVDDQVGSLIFTNQVRRVVNRSRFDENEKNRSRSDRPTALARPHALDSSLTLALAAPRRTPRRASTQPMTLQ